jgi:hypothetical protein
MVTANSCTVLCTCWLRLSEVTWSYVMQHCFKHRLDHARRAACYLIGRHGALGYALHTCKSIWKSRRKRACMPCLPCAHKLIDLD